MYKKVVVTGASGFLGRRLVERLRDDGIYRVFALTSAPDALRETIGGELVTCCCKDAVFGDQAAELLKDAVVVGCAYPRASTGTDVADGLKYVQRALEAAVRCGAEAVINVSSQSVYSQQRAYAATEETPVCLESPYAVGKYAVELLLESVCNGSATGYTSLRLASLIGPGFDQRIVNRFVRRGIEEKKITVKDNRQRFGYFDVADAAAAIASVVGWDKPLAPVYNLGAAGAYSLPEIAAAVRTSLRRAGGAEMEIEMLPGEETGCTAVDARLFYRTFPAPAPCSLQESVDRIAAWEINRINNEGKNEG